ncbi:multidrug resistance-associated protein 1 isoform X2 [Parasteatoda tepidariorum]|uniref:multidrug resistance-associated protein 1 isoform X2 n=1 Tax=Parasteatoda tepidariorum TaxID=114398 RepID=UPI001C7197F7|nr:multidrug resistance-associated protein 1 isoform X2 [Parasteatoda tepidariorum]
MNVLDDFCGSPFWDSKALRESDDPDFTLCFQYTLLTWIPCAFLCLFAPLECYFLTQSRQKELPWTGTNITRMIFAVILMLFNRKKGRHTSGILFIFWMLLIICEAFMYRSSFLQIRYIKSADDSSFIVEMIYFPLVVTEFLLSCIADIRYKTETSKGKRKDNPEINASFLSKLLFWWFNKLAVLGWKKPLTAEDLWGLSPDDCSKAVFENFQRNYQASKFQKSTPSDKTHKTTSLSEDVGEEETKVDFILHNGVQNQSKKRINIIRSLAKTYAGYFIFGSISKLVYDLLQFANPIILSLIINFVKSDEPLWMGIFYAALFYINGQVQSLILGHYFQSMYVLGMRIRTSLITIIYQKSLVMSSAARKEFTVGEIVNLMSVDSQRFMDLMIYINLIWSAPLQIIVALFMLFRILGYSVLAGFGMSLILIPINAVIAQQTKKRQEKQMKCKDERVKLINEVLSGIKVLKLYAWEEAFREKIESIRNIEVNHLKSIAYLGAVGAMLWTSSPYLVALCTFTTYILVSNESVLKPETAFVSLSLFNILRFPLTMLPHLITNMVMVSVSVKRINKFLNCEELTKYVTYDSNQRNAVQIQSGEFSWDISNPDDASKNKSILLDINMNVQKKSLVAVVGQVGSGKSSLLSAILGEMERIHGKVVVNGSIAYVSQQPWIQNSTLQNNVLFSKPLSKRIFEEVIECCGLKPDLEILPGGIHTEIGEKGINLSGGQKQRVSIARAVYSGADIYLLDDPLSAVDSHVGKHIFEKVIGPEGLLKKKTRILVTHSLTYLPQVDYIFVMKDGSIAEHGSFFELMERKGPFADFLIQYGNQADDFEEVDPKVRELMRSLSERSDIPEEESGHHGLELDDRRSSLSINKSPERRAASISRSERSISISKSDDHSMSKEKSASLTVAGAKLIQVEAAETGEVKLSVYIEYIKSIGYIWIVLILVGFILWQVFSVGANIWLSEWGKDPERNGTEGLHQRDFRLTIYGMFGLGQTVFVFVGTIACAYGTLLAATSLHNNILINVLKSPMSFFDTTPLGRIVNRFGKDVDTVDVTIPQTIRSWLVCFLQVLSTIVVISMQTPWFLLVTLPILIIYYLIQRFYLSTSRQLKRLESITKSPIYSHFSETLSGTSTIRAYKMEDKFCEHSNTLVDNNLVCYYPSVVANRWLSIRLDFIGNMIIFFAALFSVLQRDNLDAANVGLSVTYALMVTQTLSWIVRMSSELETNIVAVERIIEYAHTPTEAEWIVKDQVPQKEWPSSGNVVFNNYSTRYREGLDLVLKQICCDIKDGEKVGIVGRTGAGKSSLTLCLFRIIEAVDGTIEIDKRDIFKMGLHSLRSKITIIPQDPVLFSGTLRMNLDPFDWYNDAQLWESLEHAHLKSFVSGLEDGLNHEIVEGGENLSVGQRQLVCLARALLRKTKILVLDEATAAVDLETDSLIQETIREEFKDSSVLTIAHRLNTVMDYDRIMVLNQGAVAEFDSPTALLENKESIFYGMAKDAGLV